MTRNQTITYQMRGRTHDEFEASAAAVAERWFGTSLVNLEWTARQITYRLDAQLDGQIFEGNVTAFLD